jgi:hypothetical protein
MSTLIWYSLSDTMSSIWYLKKKPDPCQGLYSDYVTCHLGNLKFICPPKYISFITQGSTWEYVLSHRKTAILVWRCLTSTDYQKYFVNGEQDLTFQVIDDKISINVITFLIYSFSWRKQYINVDWVLRLHMFC